MTGVHTAGAHRFDSIYVDEARTLCHEVVAARGETWLTVEELSRILNAFGLPVAPSAVVRSVAEAAATASIIGYPVVLKIADQSDARAGRSGRIRTHVSNERAVASAFEEITARCRNEGQSGAGLPVVVQPLLAGVATVLGVVDGGSFGPLVAFALGSGDLEPVHDMALRRPPCTPRDADVLMQSVRCYPLLLGRPGLGPADVDALREVILRVSLLGRLVLELRELVLDQVMVLPAGHGCRIIDARARVGPPSTHKQAA